MKRFLSMTVLALLLVTAMVPSAFAADSASVCYPTSVSRNEDSTEVRKVYDLAPGMTLRAFPVPTLSRTVTTIVCWTC